MAYHWITFLHICIFIYVYKVVNPLFPTITYIPGTQTELGDFHTIIEFDQGHHFCN